MGVKTILYTAAKNAPKDDDDTDTKEVEPTAMNY